MPVKIKEEAGAYVNTDISKMRVRKYECGQGAKFVENLSCVILEQLGYAI